jgi:hypothetical protein
MPGRVGCFQVEHTMAQPKGIMENLLLLAPAAKQDRLKQARAEADREIAAYKAEREGAYQKKVSEVSSGPLHCSKCLWSN